MTVGSRQHRVRLLVLTAILAAGPATVAAHESRPVFVELIQNGPERVALRWKVPASIPRNNLPHVGLLPPCRPLTSRAVVSRPDAFICSQEFVCPNGLAGQCLSLDYPVLNPSLACLVQATLDSGVRHTRLLDPGESEWQIPMQASRGRVAWQYTWLGVRHIWEGVDHLLFLICLIVIAGTGRKMLWTITGFTLAHSVTLALSALDIVRLPVPPMEAMIALSIVFLACEIARNRRDSWSYRYPVLIAVVFGLLHGFGFASVLNEIGLPPTEVLTGLLFFNLGVELGQVLFLALVILLMRACQWVGATRAVASPPRAHRWLAYGVGTLAAFWLIERVHGFWA